MSASNCCNSAQILIRSPNQSSKQLRLTPNREEGLNFADQFMEHVGLDQQQLSTQPDPFVEPSLFEALDLSGHHPLTRGCMGHQPKEDPKLTAAMKDTGVPFRLMEGTGDDAKQLERVFEKLDLKAVLTDRWSPAGLTVASLTFSVLLDIIAVEGPVGIVAVTALQPSTLRTLRQRFSIFLDIIAVNKTSGAIYFNTSHVKTATTSVKFVPGPCTPEAPQATTSVKFVPGPRNPNREPDIESAPMLNFNRDIKSTKQALEGA
ncbi:hypothetical protein Bbelb_318900 [Branchiostoma belcheri]|nr:hypothetical protein Bbelb_318900 [Branchiostoma belcheri]